MNCLIAVLLVVSVLSVMLPNTEAGIAKATESAGRVASTVNAPWQVSIWLHGLECGAVIVDYLHVLTTAVCVHRLPVKKMRVITGAKNWEKGRKNGQYRVQEIIVHSNFDRKNFHNNIALLRLESPIVFNEETQQIAIADEDDLEEGDKLTMTGWCGSTIDELVKRKLEVSYLPHEVCKNHLHSSDVGISCTLLKSLEQPGCRWDIGGSVVNAEGQLVGLGTIGVPHALGTLNVSPRVFFYIDWIRTTIEGCGSAKEHTGTKRKFIV